MKNTIKKVWNLITTLLVTLIVILSLLIWGFRVFDYDIFVVQSGSMEPHYHVGSLVYVKSEDINKLEKGDVITFNIGNNVKATHRIHEVINENDNVSFITKGDSNDQPDTNPVLPDDIVGEVKFTIPYLGYLVTYIQQPAGMPILIAAASFILLMIILPDVLFGEDSKKEKEESV